MWQEFVDALKQIATSMLGLLGHIFGGAFGAFSWSCTAMYAVAGWLTTSPALEPEARRILILFLVAFPIVFVGGFVALLMHYRSCEHEREARAARLLQQLRG